MNLVINGNESYLGSDIETWVNENLTGENEIEANKLHERYFDETNGITHKPAHYVYYFVKESGLKLSLVRDLEKSPRKEHPNNENGDKKKYAGKNQKNGGRKGSFSDNGRKGENCR